MGMRQFGRDVVNLLSGVSLIQWFIVTGSTVATAIYGFATDQPALVVIAFAVGIGAIAFICVLAYQMVREHRAAVLRSLNEPSAAPPTLYLETTHRPLPLRTAADPLMTILYLHVWKDGLGFGHLTRMPWTHKDPPPSETESAEWCVLTNYGSETLIDIKIAVDIMVEEVIEIEGGGLRSGEVIMQRSTTLNINRVDPGTEKSARFYIQNGSPFFATMRVKDATATPIGSGSPVSIKVETNALLRTIMLFRREADR